MQECSPSTRAKNFSASGNAIHSGINCFGPFKDLPIAKLLLPLFGQCLTEYGYQLKNISVSYWGIVSRKYGYNRRHAHPDALLSGVLYLQSGQDAGALTLNDPRTAKLMETQMGRSGKAYHSEKTIMPTPGLLVVFPSWLEHEVTMTLSDDPRVILSFNIRPVA